MEGTRAEGRRGDTGSAACSPGPGSLFWRHGGRRPVIKEEAGPERLGLQHRQPLSSLPSPRPRQRWGGVWPPSGVTGDDSLPRGEGRGGGSAPNTQDSHERGTFFYFIPFKPPRFFTQWWHLLARDPAKIQSSRGKKGMSPILLESESFITLSYAGGERAVLDSW